MYIRTLCGGVQRTPEERGEVVGQATRKVLKGWGLRGEGSVRRALHGSIGGGPGARASASKKQADLFRDASICGPWRMRPITADTRSTEFAHVVF